MENEIKHGVSADKRSKIVAGVALSAVLAFVGDTGAQSHEQSVYKSVPEADFKTVEIEDSKKEDINVINRDNSPGERVIVVFPSPSESPSLFATPTISPAPSPEITPKPDKTPKPTSNTSTASSSGEWIFDPNVSWYGPGFYGHKTACGQILTTSLMGVANRTLPCGTMVDFRVKGSDGIIREKTVPVVDRGPYVAGRIWDFTGALAVYFHHTYTGSDWYRINSR